MKEKFILALAFSLAFLILFLSLDFPKSQRPLLTSEERPAFSLFRTLLPKKEKPIILIAVGDIMLGRSVNAKMRSLSDFTYPFLKTASFLKEADLTFANLESPFYDSCPTTNEGMIFCTDPKAVEGLVFAGVDIVNLANNHTRNYGQEGVEKSKNLLIWSSITPLGPEDELVVKDIKGTKIGFLGFNLTGRFQKEEIIKKVKESADKIDILVVSFHWGVEYAQKPSSWQKELAHQAVEAGADLIIGHHPHVIQEVETYQGGVVVYSLGNFVFDQPWSEETKKGLVGVFTFQNKKLVKKEFKNVYIKDYCQPVFEE